MTEWCVVLLLASNRARWIPPAAWHHSRHAIFYVKVRLSNSNPTIIGIFTTTVTNNMIEACSPQPQPSEALARVR